ncbi:UDP-N-acetylmuramoyl-L-alanine--D-glutamate ligase [Tahibacter amnicola]|uniref:UDP-N-acetylmuramoylalanine--D-glutamate ligase n=1 Tax=Tahibacter amnicola TaxID=2976241 RepID=A0ABY6BB38_9GAMM|nr:UDP-N-acetylmuramoyl-L-alanine--D-glutamate ligase [Tahibacter amnicola]UXI67279.1 UDP-N-acetylmuramoyl-L-alanine--D-glutamate ligase [Tahibacter amnicola]
MRLADLAGKRVAVWGYGREGRAALAAIRRRLPEQRVTLLCSPHEAEQARPFLGDGVDYETTEPYGGLLWTFDVVVKSPGISAYLPAVVDARAAGVRFTSGTALWFAENPDARVIAVTGTKGKSTTSALVAHLLRHSGMRVALAGNIGLPLLELLDTDLAIDGWVIELSSFQTGEAAPVDVGLINNIFEEHLDWHGTRERYVADKLVLAGVARTLVANGMQPELLDRTTTHPARRLFGTVDGWHVADGWIWRGSQQALDIRQLRLPGEHNALNLCAALTAIEAFGLNPYMALPHAASFQPLPHRLQQLGELDGVTWINDSISTTPHATIEALRSLGGRAVTVLVGGHDRGVDWSEFRRHVSEHPPHAVVALGANGQRIAALLAEASPQYQLERRTGLADAVALARQLTPAGGVILLSPGAPSFDQFQDYADRGRAFAQLAGFDPQAIASIEGIGVA